MMRGELLCWDGRRIRLPDAVEWRFQYGCGTPCDSFQLTCLWEPDSGNDLAEAVSFTAEENGERLFTGVVDECERGWDTAGGTLTVAGRGMAARLLDNEALGADYQVATVEDILRDLTFDAGRRSNESFMVLLEEVEVDARTVIVIFPVDKAFGDDLDEVMIALIIFRE